MRNPRPTVDEAATMKEPQLLELGVLLRLEVARLVGAKPIWLLLDWCKNDSNVTGEMRRILERFSRVSLSLQRQSTGRKAKNEPYADLLGVRCRMGHRTIGVWFAGDHSEALKAARTAKAVEWNIEGQFEEWCLKRGKRPSSRPPAA
jgi:hypothetical protein